MTQICNCERNVKKILCIYYKFKPLVAIYWIVSSCVCVCVCVDVMLVTLHEVFPFFLVSRAGDSFIPSGYTVLTKKHGCTPFTLCSHQTCADLPSLTPPA